MESRPTAHNPYLQAHPSSPWLHRVLPHTSDRPGVLQAAMEWVFAHMEDADFNEPLPPAGAANATAGTEVDAGAIETLAAMGFSAEHVRRWG